MILLRAIITTDDNGHWWAEDPRYPHMGEGPGWYEAMKDLHQKIRQVRRERRDIPYP